MSLESLWYEASPYLYLVVGLVSALFSNSALGLVFCVLLVTASVTILRLRHSYRSPERQAYRKYSRPH
jgi:hypothetical protein